MCKEEEEEAARALQAKGERTRRSEFLRERGGGVREREKEREEERGRLWEVTSTVSTFCVWEGQSPVSVGTSSPGTGVGSRYS